MEKTSIKFGTDGWREVIAKQFTFDNVEIVTRAIALYVLEKFGTQKPVIVGYDLRFLADQFARHAANILTEYGINVQLADSWTPTPPIALLAKEHHTAGAMMFTASHNPPEYLGIKFIPEYAGPAMPDITDVIIANVRRFEADHSLVIPPTDVATPGTIQMIAPRDEYVAVLKTLVNFDTLRKASHLKVLYDPMNGAGQGYVDALLRECGVDVTTIHDGHDPLFGGRMPEPKDEYLTELVERVGREHFDLGLSSDGDADRFGVVDENGRFLHANEIVPMVFRHLYKNRGFRGAVVRSLATSKLLDRLAEIYDVPVIETPVGFKWIGNAMREQDVIIGGEESGGFSILGYIPEKDGILADLLIVEMMAHEGKPLSEIYQDTIREAGMQFYGAAVNYHLTEEKKKDSVRMIGEFTEGKQLNGLTVTAVDKRDGVKLYFEPYNWLVVRPSGTEPVLRTYMESTDPATLEAIRRGVEGILSAEPVAH